MVESLLRQYKATDKVQHHDKHAEIAVAGNNLGKHSQHTGKPDWKLKEGEEAKNILQYFKIVESLPDLHQQRPNDHR